MYEDIYEETLKFYEKRFIDSPPSDIWPCTEERFDEKNFSYTNVNIY